jgi:hypothetical protein
MMNFMEICVSNQPCFPGKKTPLRLHILSCTCIAIFYFLMFCRGLFASIFMQDSNLYFPLEYMQLVLVTMLASENQLEAGHDGTACNPSTWEAE